MTVTIEFQNIHFTPEEKKVLENIAAGYDASIHIRSSKSLSGMETLVIAIAGRIIGDYLLRLLKYIEDKYKEVNKIEVKNMDTGEVLSLEDAKQKNYEKEL